MPKRKKKARSRTPSLLVVAVILLASVWAVEQIAARGIGPNWLQFLFAGSPLGGRQVGIIAGHRGNDSGAVCPDGLTEAEVNLDVAQRVADTLERRGVRTQLFDEFDRGLRGFVGDALVAIHADSCEVEFSGFKVANEEGGTEESQRLTACLWDEYEAATGLDRHLSTITENMTNYHAFREISIMTPAAIIELGFLQADRELLTEQPERAAAGIANGVLCFLNPSPPTPTATEP